MVRVLGMVDCLVTAIPSAVPSWETAIIPPACRGKLIQFKSNFSPSTPPGQSSPSWSLESRADKWNPPETLPYLGISYRSEEEESWRQLQLVAEME